MTVWCYGSPTSLMGAEEGTTDAETEAEKKKRVFIEEIQSTTTKSKADVGEKVRSITRQLLATMGMELEVSTEPYLDMATAISGSGPAYIYLLTESLIDAGVHLGFPRDTAVKLVTQTIRGSSSLALQSMHDHAATAVNANSSSGNGNGLHDLRYMVTSPGGTTASALYEMERGGFRTIMSDAVWAAYRRSLELGEKNSNIGPGRNKF